MNNHVQLLILVAQLRVYGYIRSTIHIVTHRIVLSERDTHVMSLIEGAETAIPEELPCTYIVGESAGSHQEFLAKFKPSASRDTVTLSNGQQVPAPWIWIRVPEAKPSKWSQVPQNSVKQSRPVTPANYDRMIAGAPAIVGRLKARCKAIDEDASIPTRSSKKNPISKKVARERAAEETQAELKKLAQETGLVSGKWLMFREHPDWTWSQIVKAMAEPDGALRGLVHTAKVSTTATDGQYVICVYVEDAFDKAMVKKALDQLNAIDVTSNSFKADVHTYAGITSKTKVIPSSLYTERTFRTKEEADALKAERHAKFEAAKAVPQKRTAEAEATAVAEAGGGFVDDTDSEDEPKPKKARAPALEAVPGPAR